VWRPFVTFHALQSLSVTCRPVVSTGRDHEQSELLGDLGHLPAPLKDLIDRSTTKLI